MITGCSRHQANSDEAQRQCAMRQDAEQRVHRQYALAFHQHQEQRHGNGGGDGAERQAEPQQKPKADAEETGMGQRLAEIGHAPPDDETADRSRHHRNAEAGKDGALEEGLGKDVKHWH